MEVGDVVWVDVLVPENEALNLDAATKDLR